MKRVQRIFLHTAAALSLLMCVTTAFLWGRSYHHSPSFSWAGDRHSTHLTMQRGSFWITRFHDWPSAELAFRAVDQAPAARPVVVLPSFRHRLDSLNLVRTEIMTHEMRREALDPSDPQISSVEGQIENLKNIYRSGVISAAGAPLSEPVVAEQPPSIKQVLEHIASC